MQLAICGGDRPDARAPARKLGSPPVLASSLVEEARRAGDEAAGVTLAVDMRGALSALVANSDEVISAVEPLFEQEAFWERFLDDLVGPGHDFPVPAALIRSLDLPATVLGCEMQELHDIEDFDVVAGREAVSGRVIIEARLTAPASLRATFPAADYDLIAGAIDVIWAEADDDIISVGISVWVTVMVDTVIDLELGELEAVEISELLKVTRL